MNPSSASTTPASDPGSPAALTAPALRRRMASWLYEGMLLFGVIFFAGIVFALMVGTPDVNAYRSWAMVWMLAVFAAYFAAQWRGGRQTLAMKTWRIRVVNRHGQPLTLARALWRFAWSLCWFLPPLAAVAPFHLPGAEICVLVAGWIAVWALLSRLMPQQQFVHDVLAGTRLINTHPHEKTAAATQQGEPPVKP